MLHMFSNIRLLVSRTRQKPQSRHEVEVLLLMYTYLPSSVPCCNASRFKSFTAETDHVRLDRLGNYLARCWVRIAPCARGACCAGRPWNPEGRGALSFFILPSHVIAAARLGALLRDLCNVALDF
eukprot:5654954-Pleurochrysis_carterae.AAC.1